MTLKILFQLQEKQLLEIHVVEMSAITKRWNLKIRKHLVTTILTLALFDEGCGDGLTPRNLRSLGL